MLDRVVLFLLSLYSVLRFCSDNLLLSYSGSFYPALPSLNILPVVVIFVALTLVVWNKLKTSSELNCKLFVIYSLPFLIYLFVSVGWSNWKLISLEYALNYLGFFAFLFTVSNLDKWAQNNVFVLLISLLLASSVSGFYQHFLGYKNLGDQLYMLDGAQEDAVRRVIESAPLGFYSYTNTFAATMMILFIIGTYGFINYLKKKQISLFCTMVCCLCASLIVLSSSRAAIILSSIAFVCLIFRRRWLLVLLSAGFLILPILMGLDTVGQRLKIWSASLNCLIGSFHNFALGVGAGGFGDHYTIFKDVQAEETLFVHNDYLQILVEFGIVGALLLTAAVIFTRKMSRISGIQIAGVQLTWVQMTSIFAGTIIVAFEEGFFLFGSLPIIDSCFVTALTILVFSLIVKLDILNLDSHVIKLIIILLCLHSFYEFNFMNLSFVFVFIVLAFAGSDTTDFIILVRGKLRAVVNFLVTSMTLIIAIIFLKVFIADRYKIEFIETGTIKSLENASSYNPFDTEIYERKAYFMFQEGERLLKNDSQLYRDIGRRNLLNTAVMLKDLYSMRNRSFYHYMAGLCYYLLYEMDKNHYTSQEYLASAKTEFSEAFRMYPAKPLYAFWAGKASSQFESGLDLEDAKYYFKTALDLNSKTMINRLKLTTDQLNEILRFITS
ncbi:MAG: O-antigen ligase family protein [Planctomycetes bacterium]|nr:O-antigen ligase family protein [Planctomycetota bacterium]